MKSLDTLEEQAARQSLKLVGLRTRYHRCDPRMRRLPLDKCLWIPISWLHHSETLIPIATTFPTYPFGFTISVGQQKQHLHAKFLLSEFSERE